LPGRRLCGYQPSGSAPLEGEASENRTSERGTSGVVGGVVAQLTRQVLTRPSTVLRTDKVEVIVPPFFTLF
jgi:hypothetical protein